MSVRYDVVEHGKPGDPFAPKKYYPFAIASGKMNLRAVAKKGGEMSRMYESVA